jgi:beta-glucosidase
MTFPRSEGQMPLYYNYKSTGRPGPKKEVFWSHYTDEDNSPLYPFGYGLSYTTFAYNNLGIQATAKREFTVSVEVKNTGTVAGEEVVQLYLTDKVASVTRPVKELKGFEKIMLKPGESKMVHFRIGEKELGFYDERGTFIVEPGEFEVMVGGSSNQGEKENFRVAE